MSKPQYRTKPKMCATCPFRDGGWEHVRPLLEQRALTEASPICHSTGKDALVKNKSPERLCRGARDLQLTVFHQLGFLDEPTEAAWAAKCDELGIQNIAAE